MCYRVHVLLQNSTPRRGDWRHLWNNPRAITVFLRLTNYFTFGATFKFFWFPRIYYDYENSSCILYSNFNIFICFLALLTVLLSKYVHESTSCNEVSSREIRLSFASFTPIIFLTPYGFFYLCVETSHQLRLIYLEFDFLCGTRGQCHKWM